MRRLSWDYQFSVDKYSIRKLPGDVISYPRGREVGCDSYLPGRLDVGCDSYLEGWM